MKNLYKLFFLLSVNISFAQDDANNHWKLGSLDFNFSTNPPTISNTGNINYGHASISDNNGNLLFYTDGIKVWDKNHNVMVNGASIGSALTPYQKCIIVPHPGNPKQFYIFNTRTDWLLNYYSTSKMLSYSLVDFTNNPLGQLVAINTDGPPYTKSLIGVYPDYSFAPLYKPLTIAKNANNDGFFVITQDHDNMISYKVDNQGLNESPIVSFFQPGQIFNLVNPNPICYCYRGIKSSMIRMSPDGQKLVGLESSGYQDDQANYRSHLYRLDFNNQTGKFTNYQNIEWYYIANNFEFSSDSNKIYMIQNKHPNSTAPYLDGEVVIKDLSNLSLPARRLTIFGSSEFSSKFSNLQRDKYGNLWVSSNYSDFNRNLYFHKIDNQNSYSNSSVVVNNISLGAGLLELPQLVLTLPQGCEEQVSLVSLEANNNYTYQYSGKIETSQNYQINSGQNITMKAGNFITLKPNTHIRSGGFLLAKIEDCPAPRSYNYNEARREANFQNELSQAKIYPNPNHGNFTIATKNITKESISVDVFDVFGKLVYQTKTNEENFVLNLPNLTSGMYLVKLTSSQTNETLKFIKQ